MKNIGGGGTKLTKKNKIPSLNFYIFYIYKIKS